MEEGLPNINICSKLLQEAEIWYKRSDSEEMYKVSVLRVMSSYLTISVVATPVQLEKGNTKHNNKNWQEKWKGNVSGRWTHELIPDIEQWYTCKHGHWLKRFQGTGASTGT